VDQRDAEHGAVTVLERILPTPGVFIRFGQDICDVYCSPVNDGTPSNETTPKG